VPSYAAFLRAINLGKNRRVSGADLCALFEGAGLDDVASFRTSGNLVFSAGRESREKLAGRVEKALEKELGYEVGVYLRTADEVRAIAEHEPFDPAAVEASKGKLQVVMLPGKPSATAGKKVLALATDDDLLSLGEREVFWLPSGGYMEAKLDRKALDALVGPTTVRTKGTVEALAAKFFPG
jgi:uncharacterized protein (DUF1697 family)